MKTEKNQMFKDKQVLWSGIIFLVGAFFFYMSFEAGDKLSLNPDPAANPEIVNTWPTYTDQKSGTSFKYPTKAGSKLPAVDFLFVVSPEKLESSKYYENSIFKESERIGQYDWDISLSTNPAFVAYQTVRGNTRYTFVFQHQTEKDQTQQSIISTFK